MLPVAEPEIIGQADQEFHDAAIEKGMTQFETGVSGHPVVRFARVGAVARLESNQRLADHL